MEIHLERDGEGRLQFNDLTLARRLEATEAVSCAQFAVTRKSLFPNCRSEWTQIGGATVVFDGAQSPVTQTFGLGLFEPLTLATLTEIEAWFTARDAPIQHEICPLVGVEALDLLCARGYRPIEIASVLHQPVPEHSQPPAGTRVDLISPDQSELWAEISARAWSQLPSDSLEMFRDFGAITATRQKTPCFLAYANEAGAQEPAAAAALSIYCGVALFIGAATVTEFRRRGLQSALLAERLRHAHAAGCDLAMMVAEAGGESQRNAERNGFRIAYTRIKWKLAK
jgi:GNAT superfamily N-acetyltransferase